MRNYAYGAKEAGATLRLVPMRLSDKGQLLTVLLGCMRTSHPQAHCSLMSLPDAACVPAHQHAWLQLPIGMSPVQQAAHLRQAPMSAYQDLDVRIPKDLVLRNASQACQAPILATSSMLASGSWKNLQASRCSILRHCLGLCSVAPGAHLRNLQHISVRVAEEHCRPPAHGLGVLHARFLQPLHQRSN